MQKLEDQLWCADKIRNVFTEVLEMWMEKLPGEFELKKMLVREIEDANKRIENYKKQIYQK